MARPLKDGVDYFPKDTDFYNDDKVKLLRAEFGSKGMYLLDYILCEIYKNGYYIQWDADKCALVSDGAGCGCTPAFVGEVINGCIRRSFFDKRVFDVFGVLTSAGIQRRFVRMLNQRTKYTFIKEYFLLDVNDLDDVPESVLVKLAFKKINTSENSVINNENPVMYKDNAQNKINKNKEDENILYNNKYQLIRDVYERNIGTLSESIGNVLMDWLNTVDVSLIIYAIEKAVENGLTSPGYIYGVLIEQSDRGITTGQQARIEELSKGEKL